jgi:hypothetical protein
MNKTEVGVIVVTDMTGNICVGAAQNPDSPISIGGNPEIGKHLTSSEGRPTCYNGRAAGVEKWAVDNGLEYERYILEIDLDEKRILSGRYERR